MTRDTDSGSGRVRDHRDYAGRSVTRPGVDPLDATTDDGFTPIDALLVRIATLEASAIRHDALLAESSTAAASREWRQMRADVEQAKADAKLCRDQQERSAKWAPLFKWIKGVGIGGVLTVLIWAITALSERGRSARNSEIQVDTIRVLVDDVRRLQLDAAADHALLQQHLRPGATP